MIKLIDILKEEIYKTQAIKNARDTVNRSTRKGITEVDDYYMGTPSGDTDAMNIGENDLSEEVHKTQAMKAALDIANSYARRGYYPREAVNDAALSIEHTMGYKLSDEEKETLTKLVYVHPNFR